MKPYRRTNKVFMVELRSASRLGRVKVLLREFASDVYSLWRYGAPFPTFLKLIGTLILCLLVVMPLFYPLFVLIITFFTFEGLYLSWWTDQSWRFLPNSILKRALSVAFYPCATREMWKVRDVLTRGILLIHSLATSVDYLCVMQSLLDDS
ncbi:uncharacterized protein LOC113518049 isoform X2 [Galleria mellonella]|uniref:Uncharacterized protein LOC113518049 isoform X2 n=1 Tax=Galleria mellonella TaxID=7137 RepID=A0A6J3CBG9_GALME|nr:uncharacterized protein LOC113518049 isoform X2 [Galleria mellonella]